MDEDRTITVNGEKYTFPSGHVFPFYADVQTLKIHEYYKPDVNEHDVNSSVQQYITGTGSFFIGEFSDSESAIDIENKYHRIFFNKVKLYSYESSNHQYEIKNITFYIKPISILSFDQFSKVQVGETILISPASDYCHIEVYIPESIISHLVAEIKNVRIGDLGIGVEFTRNAYWGSSGPDIYLIPSKDDTILRIAGGKFRGLICSSNPKDFRLDELYSLTRGIKSSLVRLGWIGIVLLILLLLFK